MIVPVLSWHDLDETRRGLLMGRAGDRRGLPSDAVAPVLEAIRRDGDAAVRDFLRPRRRRGPDAGPVRR